MKDFLKACLPDRWELAGFVLMGIAAACFSKAGQIEYAARHVWEDAERIQKSAVIVHGDDCPGHTTGDPGESCRKAWGLDNAGEAER